MKVCVYVCVRERETVHVFVNNKASENEEELNCVSHFSFSLLHCLTEERPEFLSDGADK